MRSEILYNSCIELISQTIPDSVHRRNHLTRLQVIWSKLVHLAKRTMCSGKLSSQWLYQHTSVLSFALDGWNRNLGLRDALIQKRCRAFMRCERGELIKLPARWIVSLVSSKMAIGYFSMSDTKEIITSLTNSASLTMSPGATYWTSVKESIFNVEFLEYHNTEATPHMIMPPEIERRSLS